MFKIDLSSRELKRNVGMTFISRLVQHHQLSLDNDKPRMATDLSP